MSGGHLVLAGLAGLMALTAIAAAIACGLAYIRACRTSESEEGAMTDAATRLLELGMRPEDVEPALAAARAQAGHEDATRIWWAVPGERA